MSCEFCRKANFGSFSAKVDGAYSTIYLAGGSSRYPLEDQFNYCPVCGRSLKKAQSPNKMQPLTYDEVRKMDGEPVYSRDSWYLVWVDDEGKVWLQRPMTLGEPNGIRNCRDTLVECIWAYGVDVYRYSPEEEAL